MNTKPLSAALAASSLVVLAAWLRPLPLGTGGGNEITTLPCTLSAPGHYYVTQNLNGMPGEQGILIDADDVVIDLGGFTLTGGAGSQTGIVSINGSHGARVSNGTLVDWGGAGVNLGLRSVARDLSVRGCDGSGIAVTTGLIDSCIAEMNEGSQITMSAGVVRDCHVIAHDTAGAGLFLSQNAIAERVSVLGGSPGIFSNGRVQVLDCSVAGYYTRGIEVGEASLVRGCIVSQPHQDSTGERIAIEVGDHATVVDSIVHAVTRGISTGRYARVHGVNVSECSSTGIATDANSRVTECVVGETQFTGIFAGPGTVVREDLVGESAADGILLAEHATAQENVALGAGHTAIRVPGDGARVVGNTAIGSEKGIVIQGQHTLVIENRSIDNVGPDFTIPYGNPFGPTLNASWAIQGSQPQANFRTPFP